MLNENIYIDWPSCLLLSYESFLSTLRLFTSVDPSSLLSLWVYRSGLARFSCTFTFNRKKSALELEIKQDMVGQKGYRKYSGPLSVTVQEIDGSFTHHLHVEENNATAASSRFDIVCHSKGRKNKKKKVVLVTGEEVDIELVDTDSPVLWLRIDADMRTLRDVRVEQPDHHWHNQLRYERDIWAQLDALALLSKYSNQSTRYPTTNIYKLTNN